MIAGILVIACTLPIKTQTLTIPIIIKLTALLVTILGLIVAIDILNFSLKHKTVHTFSNILAFFPMILHRTTPKIKLKFGQNISTHITDMLWYEKLGPKGAANQILPPIKTTTNFQSGIIKIYIILFLTNILLILTLSYSP